MRRAKNQLVVDALENQLRLGAPVVPAGDLALEAFIEIDQHRVDGRDVAYRRGGNRPGAVFDDAGSAHVIFQFHPRQVDQ